MNILRFLQLTINFILLISSNQIGTDIISEEEKEKKLTYTSSTKTNNFNRTNEYSDWLDIDLNSEFIITKIGWKIDDEENSKNHLLHIILGSNNPNFLEAIPLTMITTVGKKDEINYYKIYTNKAFRYLRYIGPNEHFFSIYNIEIYGYKNSYELKISYYQPTNLPLVVINTQNNLEPLDKENKVNCKIYIIDKNEINTEGNAGIKLRGNSSKRFDKKPYHIKFEEKKEVLDFPSISKKFNLVNNCVDKSLIRNLLAFEISKLFEMSYTVTCKPVDVILNGDYRGTYNLCEHIEVSEDKVNIEKMDNSMTEEPEISGGYFFELDGYASVEKNKFYSLKNNPFTIKYPKLKNINNYQKNYIRNEFSMFESLLYYGDYNKLDLDSFCKYLLIEELTGNPDEVFSINFYKKRDNPVFYFGPVWDFDLAFDNDIRVYPTNNESNFIFKYGSQTGRSRNLFEYILNITTVRERVFDKWLYYGYIKLDQGNILIDLIDNLTELINESQKLNYMRWDFLLNDSFRLQENERTSFEKEIIFVKEYIIERINWMNKFIFAEDFKTRSESITPVIKVNYSLVFNN